MISTLIALFGGVLIYLLVCATSVAAGLGLLRLARVSLPYRSAVFFAPTVLLAFWSVFLGIGVSLHTPVRYLAPPLYAMTLLLVCVGVIGLGRKTLLRQRTITRAYMGLALLLPVVVFFQYFLHGLADYSGSAAPDGWSYVALGQTLWNYPRGADGGLAPLYQYCAHLGHVRFISEALLGVLSFGDAQMAVGLFLAWVLFIFASACIFFAKSENLPSRLLVPFLLLSVLSGWIYDVAWAGNFDNALSLPYLPALAGSVSSVAPARWNWRLLLALLFAGLFFTYPETAVLILAGFLFVAWDRIRSERVLIRGWVQAIAAAGAGAIALTLPFVGDMMSFVRNQLAAAQVVGSRPGEGMFAGLLSRRHLPSALWALGGEFRQDSGLWARNGLAVLLSLLVAAGLFEALRRRRYGFVLMTGIFLGAGAVMIVRQRYSYGAYKMLLLASWPLAFLCVRGLSLFARHLSLPGGRIGRRMIAVTPALLILPFNHFAAKSAGPQLSPMSHEPVSTFRALEHASEVTKNDGMLVVLDDWLDNEWAVYYLRQASIEIHPYRMYMAQPHVVPYMERAKHVPPGEVRFLMTDKRLEGLADTTAWTLAWSAGPYRIWRATTRTWVVITEIQNPNGLEVVDGKPFIWIGTGDTRLDLFASKSGTLRLSGDVVPGPSLPERPERRFSLRTTAGIERTVTLRGSPGEAFMVPVSAGQTSVTIHSLDTPSRHALDNGDTRPLLLGIKDLKPTLEEGPASISISIEEIVNANGLERVGGEPFFWMGKGATTVTVQASRSGQLLLGADFTAGPSLPSVAMRRVHVRTDHGYDAVVEVLSGRQSIKIPVPPGRTVVSLIPIDVPTLAVQPNGDTRPLLLGVSRLSPVLDTD